MYLIFLSKIISFLSESVNYEVTVTYIEIYNEIVYDLLSPAPDNQIIPIEKSNIDIYEVDYDQLK